MRRLVKYISPKSFDDGLARCNALGKQLVAGSSPRRFLDTGCGDGELTMEFARAARALEVHGIEFVDEQREQGAAKGIAVEKTDLNEKWGYEDETFDLILSSQLIEHLHNSRLYLEECYRCLAPGGRLLVLTENLSSWVNIGALVLGWQPFSATNINGWSLGNPLIWHVDLPKDQELYDRFARSGISSVGHVRVLAYRGLRDLLARVGFMDIEMRTRGYLPLSGATSDFLCDLDRRHGNFIVAFCRKL